MHFGLIVVNQNRKTLFFEIAMYRMLHERKKKQNSSFLGASKVSNKVTFTHALWV